MDSIPVFKAKAAKPVTPPRVPTDEVIPLHFLDDQFAVKALILVFTYRFDDVLDFDRLHSSLAKLMEMEGWRKLGARLRMNVRKHRILSEMYDRWYV